MSRLCTYLLAFFLIVMSLPIKPFVCSCASDFDSRRALSTHQATCTTASASGQLTSLLQKRKAAKDRVLAAKIRVQEDRAASERERAALWDAEEMGALDYPVSLPVMWVLPVKWLLTFIQDR